MCASHAERGGWHRLVSTSRTRELTNLSLHPRSSEQGRASRLVLVLLRDRENPLERWIFSFDDLHRLGLTSAQRRDQQ